MRSCAQGLAAFLTWLLPLAGVAQTAPAVSVQKIGDGVWMAQTEKGSNAGWFLLGDAVVVVDTGSDAATGKVLQDKVQETTGKPVRFVVITHAHGDHAEGLAPFVAAGAEVICQENAAPAVAPLVAKASTTKSGLLAMADRLAFFGSPRRAAIYFLGPAHSSGDIFLYLPDDKILFTGDLVLGGKAPYMQSPDVDAKGWETALNRLAQLDVNKIIPGHGSVTDRKALADTYGYVKKINELAQMLLRENLGEDFIEARLRRPNSGIEPADITPDVIANIRGVLRAERARAAKPTPVVTPARPPEKKAPEKKKG
jgi:glyoxylase-like metal-dependent hydrolase (beta-lactamase superfamily II)